MRIVALLVGIGMSLTGTANAGPEGLVRSRATGAWSDPKTWERGVIPGSGARVQVRASAYFVA